MIHFTHNMVENLVGKQACERCEACVCHPEKAVLLLAPCVAAEESPKQVHASHVTNLVVVSGHDIECMVCNACSCHSRAYLEKECLDDEGPIDG